MFTVDPTTTGIVLTDPQNEFLSPGHPGYELLKPVILQNNTVGNLVKLLQSAKQKGYKVFVSPHYLYPHDHKWQFKGAEETLLFSTYAYDRPDARSPVPPASGAAFVPDLLPFLEDGQTIIANAHKIASPATNDLCLQLRKQGVSKIVLAGVVSNVCVESHMRHLIEEGFEVAIVQDATAAPADGFNAALVNFKGFASAVWTTEQAVVNL